jgi:hypothetical protein
MELRMNVISSVEQLRALSRTPSILRFFGRVPDCQFAIPELSETSNREATERLSNYRNACGCFAGGLVMGLAVIGFVIAYALSGRGISDFGVMDFLMFLGLFTASTLVGKSLGMLWARVRAIQLVRRIATRAAAQCA